MPRYGINVNYAPPRGEGAVQNISAALDAYQRRQDAMRGEQNQIAAEGGVATGPAPQGSMDRLRAVGNFLKKRVLGQTDAPEELPPDGAEPPQAGGAVASPAVWPEEIPGTVRFPSAPTAAPASGPGQPWQMPRVHTPDAVTQNAGRPALPAGVMRPGIGAALAAANPGVQTPTATAVSPTAPTVQPSTYDYVAASGQHYTVDPMLRERQKSAMQIQAHTAETEADLTTKDRFKSQSEDAQIRALTDAGMDPAQARAKVLNNVVRYDEQFGQKPRVTGQMTPEERQKALEQRDRLATQSRETALEIARMRQSGQGNSNQLRQREIELRSAQQELARQEALLRSDDAEATNTGKAVTTLQTNPVVSMTPQGQGAITTAQRDAAAAKARRDAQRDRVAGGGTTPAPTAKRKLTQAQYDAARAKYGDDVLAKNYDVTGLTRKP